MEDARLTFHEHLGELRTRLVRAAVAVFVGFLVAWTFRQQLFDLLSAPVREGLADNGIYRLTAIDVTETIFVYLKLSIVAGILIGSPVVFWQLWAFISPGLHRHEKQYVLPITVFSVLFFFLGVLFCHRVLLPFVTDFLVEMTLEHPDVSLQVTVQNTFSFALSLLLAFGAAFELPLVIFFLSALGLTSPRGLLRFFRYFVLLAFVIGAVFTPPDPVSQVMMAVPLIALYLLGIGLSALAIRQKQRSGEGALSTQSWALIGVVLVSVVGALGYVSWILGVTPSPLDHVPASARVVVGLRWADAKNRAALGDALAAWTERHPDSAPPTDVLAHAGLALRSDDEQTVSDVIAYVSYDGRVAALLAGEPGDDPLGAAAARLGAGWELRDEDGRPTLVRGADSADDPGGLVVTQVAPDVVVAGERGAVAAGQRAFAAGTGLSAVSHRRQAVEEARRAGPLWLVAWRDPVARHDLLEILVGTWDQPLVQGWTSIAGDVTVNATLAAPSPGAAARFARQLDQWREVEGARELQAEVERARSEGSRRTSERLARLAAAVEDAVRRTEQAVAAAAPGRGADLHEPLARLAALRTELEADDGAGPPGRIAPPNDGPRVDDVPRLEASADGPVVTVAARLTPAGAAALADLMLRWLGQEDPAEQVFPVLVENGYRPAATR